MLKHIVMWRLQAHAAGHTKAENLSRIRVMLSALPASIPEIGAFEFGSNISELPTAFDCALYSEFEDEAALLGYQSHPEHVRVKAFIATVTEHTAVVDYLV